MVTVRFNDVDEFLEELRADADASAVERRIVRVTRYFRPHVQLPNVRYVSVVASYVKAAVYPTSFAEEVHDADAYGAEAPREKLVDPGSDPQRVLLDTGLVGELGWSDAIDAQTLENADAATGKIAEYVRSLGFEDRGGIFELGQTF